MTTARIALRIAYLGAGFAGWQRQPAERTVQATIESALARLYNEPVALTGAGRTDAGVHAAGQVAHFDAPRPIPVVRLAPALNSMLPADVRVLAARRVAPEFHARLSPHVKRYRYRLATGPALDPWEALRTWLVPGRLDVAAMAAALPAVVGTHDFAAFALSGHSGTGRRGTVRTLLAARLLGRGRRLALVLDGEGFLRGMARRIAGALVEIGRAGGPVTWIEDLLRDSATRPPAPSAPAHGLTLERVRYLRAVGASPGGGGGGTASRLRRRNPAGGPVRRFPGQ